MRYFLFAIFFSVSCVLAAPPSGYPVFEDFAFTGQPTGLAPSPSLIGLYGASWDTNLHYYLITDANSSSIKTEWMNGDIWRMTIHQGITNQSMFGDFVWNQDSDIDFTSGPNWSGFATYVFVPEPDILCMSGGIFMIYFMLAIDNKRKKF